MDKRKSISLAANVVAIPVGNYNSRNMTDEELTKRINHLFVQYCCGGIDKPEEELTDGIKLCREIFTNGYKAGYNDLLCKVTNEKWEE